MLQTNRQQSRIKEYYQTEALNQSKLKKLLKSLSAFNQKDTEPSEAMIIGSIVDSLITQEDKQFVEVEKITSVQKSILKQLHDTLQGEPLELHKETILDVLNEFKWYLAWKDETRIKKIMEAINEPYQLYSENCEFVTKEQNDKATQVAMSLITNQATSNYLQDDNNLYQYPIYFTHRAIYCKALIDLIYIENIDGKTYYRPLDIKTTALNTDEFMSSVNKYRYDIQASWYMLAMQKHFGQDKVLPFGFIVESTKTTGTPMVYMCSEHFLEIGKSGEKGVATANGKIIREEVKGYEQLIDLYKKHELNNFQHKQSKLIQNLYECIDV